MIVGVRRDEEPTRAKERYFSPRDKNMEWNVEDQPPELWDQFKTDFEKGTHIRIHPLLHWTELNIWEYIERENIPIIPLYFANDKGERYRSLGCCACTAPIKSNAKTVREIIEELRPPKLPNAPAARRTRKAKTPSRNCGGMGTCELVYESERHRLTNSGETNADGKWDDQCRLGLNTALITGYKPVLDDAPWRAFNSMAEYRSWCAENLPEYLGFRPAKQ